MLRVFKSKAQQMTPEELLERSQAFFQNSKFDSLLLRNFEESRDVNFNYFSGVNSEDCFFILRKNSKPAMLANVLEAGNLKDFPFKVLAFKNEKELNSLLRKSLGKNIGLNFEYYRVKNFENLKKTLKGRKISDASETFAKLRSLKSAEEIRLLKEACKVSEMGVSYFENFFKQGMTELEVAEKITEFFKRMNCSNAFEPIVAFKENSSTPHHENSNKIIENSGVLLLDFGAKFQGYCSDISRTYFVGKSSVEVLNAYTAVFEAKKLAEKLLVPKAKAKKVFTEVASFLQKRLNAGMLHSLGHGVGLETHDFPSRISKKAEFQIAESQCFAIEPAFYGKEFGIRIEDNYLITSQGAKALTSAPRELKTL